MTHTCNAWCEGDEHTTVFYTRDDPPKALQLGMLQSAWYKDDKPILVLRYERASTECAPLKEPPDGYVHAWLAWFTYLT